MAGRERLKFERFSGALCVDLHKRGAFSGEQRCAKRAFVQHLARDLRLFQAHTQGWCAGQIRSDQRFDIRRKLARGLG